jgi:hypothetical protein
MRWNSGGAESRLNIRNNRVHLLREVEKFLRRSDVAPTRFGRDALGDPRFVFDLRNGRDPRPETVERVRAYLGSGQ